MTCVKLSLFLGLLASVLLVTRIDLEGVVRQLQSTHSLVARRLTSNTDNQTESPWPEDYSPEIIATEIKTKSGMPFIRYNGCHHCAEEAFCNYASNPGCGGSAMNGVVTFRNIRHAYGCRVKPVLSIPRSYIRDLDDLRAKPGTYSMLKTMLHSGFDTYRSHGHSGPVQQCIHQSWAVSVRWVHLHTFCTGTRFDGMPGGSSLCATMHSHDDAAKIANWWSR